MRSATASVAAVIVLALGISMFWPEAGDPAGKLVAQPPTAEPKNRDAKSARHKQPTLEDKLDQRIDFLFTDTPLRDVITYLSDTSGIQIYVKEKKLEEMGVSLDMPVNKNLKQVRLSTGLELLLDDVGLTHVEKDDLLVITSPEDAESVQEIRVYDCRDLLAMPGPNAPGYGAQPGMTPGGGYGNPGGIPGGYSPPSYGPPDVAPGPASGGPGGFGLPDTKAADEPGADSATTPAPRGAGSPPTIPGAIPAIEPRAQVGGAPDGSAGPGAAPGGIGGAGLAPYGGGMMGPGMMPGSMGGAMGGMGGMSQQPMSDHDMRAMRLMNIITTAVDNQSWSEMGGPGTISEYNGLIVITQTDETHRKVEKVLDMLREAANLGGPRTNKVVR